MEAEHKTLNIAKNWVSPKRHAFAAMCIFRVGISAQSLSNRAGLFSAETGSRTSFYKRNRLTRYVPTACAVESAEVPLTA